MKIKEIFVEYVENCNLHSFSQEVKDSSAVFGDEFLRAEYSLQDARFTLFVTPSKHVKITQVYATGEIETKSNENTRYLLNGYQSWTDTREYSIGDKEKDCGCLPEPVKKMFSFKSYGDYTFYGKRLSRGNFHGWTYAYARSGEAYEFIGSLSELNTSCKMPAPKSYAFALIKFFTKANKFQIFCDADTINYEISEPKTLIDAVLLTGKEDEVFDKYFEIAGIEKPKSKPVMGWTSWYDFYQNINEKCLMDNLQALSEPFTVFQIDDGYEPFVGDWLTVNQEKFPNGLEPIIKKANEKGLKPGIWIAPFSAEVKSEVASNHPDWIVKDEAENPVLCGCNWSGFYGLDIYNPEVREYITKFCRHFIDDLGLKLLKIDFLYSCCLVPCKDKTRGQIMHDALVFFREASKGAELLGCGVPLGSAFGLVDYCRIGTDVSLSWDDRLVMKLCHRERPSTKNTILNSLYRRQLDGRAFLNDPDVFLLRNYNEKLGTARKSLLSEINALAGSLVFTSDNPSTYDDWQKSELKKVTELRNAKITGVESDKNEITVNYTLNNHVNSLKFNRKTGKQ